ncbi:MAG: aldo/keto reductase [Candidatus Promineifilaceae bacterium]|nr:aldo/keto reductase [Candidatus Promineifilaceae bacterium]
MLTGYATAEGTQAYAEDYPEIDYRPLNETGWLVSPAGFGGYRVDVSIGDHHRALRHALLNGVNLVDTSSNYAGGGSEKLVGTVLRRLDDEGHVSREAVVVVSKGGYLQGENYKISQQRKEAGNPFPDLVEYAEGLEHCIHPEFLEHQLGRSLNRLQMETLDVYLLHNPEYYLNWAWKAGVELEEARAEYYRRIELAFRHLETEVAQGRIRYYGISSNTFPSPAGALDFTSLARVWELAESIDTDHHFRVIQLPMNLLETEGVTEPNQPEEESVIAFARQRRLGVLINRPLNAIADNQITRLAEFGQAPEGVGEEDVAAAIETLVAQEDRFREEMLPLMDLDEGERKQLAEIFTVGQALQGRWRQFGTYYNWDDVQTRYLVPRVQSGVNFLSGRSGLPAPVASWLTGYVNALNEAMQAVNAVYQAQAEQKSRAVRERAAAADEEWAEAERLSQMAVRALRSTAGVTTVLVGMRRREYVDDVLAELQREVSVRPRDESWAALAE